MEQLQNHTCSLILFDLSGFTQLVYQVSRSAELMERLIAAVRRVFDAAGESARCRNDVRILITTGDGFMAMATGKESARTALDYARHVQEQFREHLLLSVQQLPFRQRIDLRVALHHGCIYEVPLDACHGGYPLFIGDDLNLLARVVNSQTARRHTFALTRPFLELLLAEQVTEDPDEVIQDRNQYPEQIEIFRLPEAAIAAGHTTPPELCP